PPGRARAPCCRAGLSTSRASPSGLSVSNHHSAPTTALAPTLSVLGFPLARVWASPSHRRLARRNGRIEFVILRMARSPRVALHHLLRGRSYLRLQDGRFSWGGLSPP